MNCTCGHAEEEHYPATRECGVWSDGGQCDCVAFEWDGDEDPG